MRAYRPDASPLRFASLSVLSMLLGLATAGAAAFLWALLFALFKLCDTGFLAYLPQSAMILLWLAAGCTIFSAMSLFCAVMCRILFTDADRIRWMVWRGLCCSAYGNPLNLKAGELLPRVGCWTVKPGQFSLKIFPGGTDIESVTKLAPHISSVLRKRFADYAVTLVEVDNALLFADYKLENVKISKAIKARSVKDLRTRSGGITVLLIQNGTVIDLTTSGSMLFAGKTRSGKTTAIISILLQVLMAGRDKYGSVVIIIDPKRAELSRLPHVITLDIDGTAFAILEALRRFCEIIEKRQQILNDLSEQTGDAVHWWAAGMHPAILFLDEYVACRSLFPTKAAKGSEDYCLAEFDNLLRRIITMGASAGCYVIISIAEASVQEGGLPSMLRSAMSTKVLMRPTMPEARLLWPAERLEALAMSMRVYGPGDAWFSSTDGEHDDVCFVHFPTMDFPVYRELKRLLEKYYGD